VTDPEAHTSEVFAALPAVNSISLVAPVGALSADVGCGPE